MSKKLIFCFMAVVVLTTASFGTDYNFGPSDDTYVQSSASSTNYGTDTFMKVKSGQQYSYVKFTVSGVSGTVTAATLKLPLKKRQKLMPRKQKLMPRKQKLKPPQKQKLKKLPLKKKPKPLLSKPQTKRLKPKKVMRVDILTLFPEMFESPLSHSILKRAQAAGIVDIVLTNIRDFAAGDYKKVDDKPYGGGPGMVMMPGPLFDCFEHVEKLSPQKPKVILLTPQGQKFDQKKTVELSKEQRLILISGRYEGFDERIRTGLNAEQISIGDYVLSGGELAAMVIVDAVVRLLGGALGDEESSKDESFSEGFLEYPQYTRPEVFRDMKVPDILLSGDHGKIAQWRKEKSLERTKKLRPDLLKK